MQLEPRSRPTFKTIRTVVNARRNSPVVERRVQQIKRCGCCRFERGCRQAAGQSKPTVPLPNVRDAFWAWHPAVVNKAVQQSSANHDGIHAENGGDAVDAELDRVLRLVAKR